jgi:fatty acid desaturase
MNAPLDIAELHGEEERGPHWVSRAAFPVVLLIFVSNQVALGLSVYHAWYWAAAVLLLTSSHLMHGLLIGFHEASHGLLRKSRRINEIDGILLGTFSLMSFSLYRAAHQSHHAHLATEKDEELWPFVHPSISRGRRLFAALLELNLGYLFTPFLFFRTFLRPGSPIRNTKLRRRIWAEIALMAGIWIVLLSGVCLLGIWKYFLWMYLAPAILAGNLQSWRKYIEHVGMTGDTVNSSTRSIIADGPIGRFVSFSLLHEPFHGVHHRYSGLTHAELPAHSSALQPRSPHDIPPFPSYRHALVHLLHNLRDPRVGAQWRMTS